MLPYFQTSILPIYFFDQSVIILVLYNDFNYYPNSCSLFSKIFCVPACYSCFFFCFALIFSSQNYLLALQYFVLFSNCFLLCLLSNNFDCSQIVFGWVCSAIFFLFSNIFGWVCLWLRRFVCHHQSATAPPALRRGGNRNTFHNNGRPKQKQNRFR